MTNKYVFAVAALAVLFCAPSIAQDCTTQATIGYFDVSFEGATYDGSATEFTYCITGLDQDGFHALSNWELALDTTCIGQGDIVGCSPEPCFYQVDDPNTGVTGIKYDDLEVEKGETACFSFSLAGDWTMSIAESSLGLKAATDVFLGNICGPVCKKCEARLAMLTPETAPTVDLLLLHNRPPVVNTSIEFRLINNANNALIKKWFHGPVELVRGQELRIIEAVPDVGPLAPGSYKLKMKFQGMAGWVQRSINFTVAE